ncbi:MAG: rhodanese-like domain-containing protein [Cyanobacteria bacterium J06621_8]
MSEQQAEAQVISQVKEVLTAAIPTPPEATPVASAQALKERLRWGEPALTILDGRDREAFLEERIRGAMLLEDTGNFAENRDIYVYASSDEETAAAADKLRQAGYSNVSQLQGGLAAWKAVKGATEGRAA